MSEPKKMQAIRISFSNGAQAEFLGPAVVEEHEMDKVTITGLEIGPPEDLTDEIRKKILDNEKT